MEGICLGISDGRGHGIGVSGESMDRPNLTAFLVSFAEETMPYTDPKTSEYIHKSGEKGFPYTCIQINKNPPQNCHIDKNNEGPSYIIGLGDYSHTAQDCYGGWLWIEGRGPVDIKNKWVLFDGNIPHGTIGNYVGTRYSLIYFTRHNYDRFGNVYEQRLKEGKPLGRKLGSPENFRRLTGKDDDEWGFPYPEPGYFEKITYELPPEARKEQGKRLFELFMSEPRLPFIAIPSHERVEILKSHSLAFLQRHNYPMNMVRIFVAPQQMEFYKPLEEEYSGLCVIEGGQEIVDKRNGIIKHFKVGDKIVEMDDDIKNVIYIPEKKPISSFQAFVQENFLKLKPFRTGMWGLQTKLRPPPDNAIRGDAFGMRSCCCLVGYINDHCIHLTMKEKEDFQRVLIYHTNGKPILKRQDYGIDTKCWANKGGVGADHTMSQRIERQNKAAALLKEQYPDLINLMKPRETGKQKGMIDVRFIHQRSTPEKDFVRYDEEDEEDEDKIMYVVDVVSDLAPQFKKLTHETQLEVSGEYKMMPYIKKQKEQTKSGDPMGCVHP
eukprot:SAG11_NODE_2938_length_2822_cov_388.174807_1_plen_549_part_10